MKKLLIIIISIFFTTSVQALIFKDCYFIVGAAIEKKFDKNIKIDYIDNQLFLYETILDQIKHIKAVDLNCYEIFESMVYVATDSNGTGGGDNFKLIKKKWAQQSGHMKYLLY